MKVESRQRKEGSVWQPLQMLKKKYRAEVASFFPTKVHSWWLDTCSEWVLHKEKGHTYLLHCFCKKDSIGKKYSDLNLKNPKNKTEDQNRNHPELVQIFTDFFTFSRFWTLYICWRKVKIIYGIFPDKMLFGWFQ